MRARSIDEKNWMILWWWLFSNIEELLFWFMFYEIHSISLAYFLSYLMCSLLANVLNTKWNNCMKSVIFIFIFLVLFPCCLHNALCLMNKKIKRRKKNFQPFPLAIRSLSQVYSYTWKIIKGMFAYYMQ